MEKIDLWNNEKYIEFYRRHQKNKDNIVSMLEGCKNRMCVCDTKEELYMRYAGAIKLLTQLLQEQVVRLDFIEEIISNDN